MLNNSLLEAVSKMKMASDWPNYESRDVQRVVEGLRVLNEALFSGDEMCKTRLVLAEAVTMLRDYETACMVVEGDKARVERLRLFSRATAEARESAAADFEAHVKAAAEERAKELIRDLGKIQKNARRRQARKGAKRG